MTNHSPTTRRIAKTILNGFDAYFADFQNITLGAKARFERAAWHEVHQANRERIDLYKTKVNQVLKLVHSVTSKDTGQLDLWREARAAYAQLIANHSNYEIAETFFNSVFCSQFQHDNIHDNYIFVKPSRAPDDKPLRDYSIYISYSGRDGLEYMIEDILNDYGFSVPWENQQRDIKNICAALRKAPLSGLENEKQLRVDMLESVFYRNKAAYLVGRMMFGGEVVPLILPCLNNGRGGIFVDTVLYNQDAASIVFSFTRSYFMVDAPIPSRFVRFLSTIMPLKERSELYNSIGFHKHGKTEFYRHVLAHMKVSNDKFVIAPGIKGMVMSVFTLPSYPVVFKVIKDKFDRPKTVTEEIVKEKYKFVSRSDRVGRMADTQEYTNFIFYRNRFSDELLEELKQLAPSKLHIDDKWVIIKHLYVERRMEPLNLYLQGASAEEVREAMEEYGNAIKQLAAANIFPGDMLLKNFGVTRHGRVVFYDYDELCPLTECNFRKIPEPQTAEQELSDKPWYTVDEMDVFPEEFRLFFSGNPEARKAFEEQHSDLYDYRYWQRLQERIRAGHIESAFPYRRKWRFKRSGSGALQK
ncbi:bifunctional isocitrate dehydrogenase kinase/phosphatase [Microbulbifer thermotolerans]|uniref:Isocitrate dehydrogenase kinase/phosphatase n=1 Tax=Microbulbifer thermotolerans TaxID=252514 RepID=A0A143HPJ6_MICTH|nr:bifunctional isocitrate dehydrogenase kinase/phosphatase [Microbulbifer thermotolerans]AMX03350.1 bifunctional isocitrate dehydrogenase kinase/phosphatase [Microbulbifer thermotolerans]MCX2781132.1 bifunctional isocitrate dehydrogenase kinase/phosphatase [Microbulbifer thermotolerans]MCX2782985.1 bifunctional isocitrate dehydrogenase kinase/phosphatase [Microbulbifer thermotolerans]MCX2795488.1 bifunctional isocitrate dehydrogenase kinase/phosphatase [Microbulbifer thermotolerans]MCX2801087